MIVSPHEQNSKEWDDEKIGLLTASNFKKTITSKGVRSKMYDDYIFIIAEERKTGVRVETYYNGDMDLGHEREQEGREYYEFQNDAKVELVGLCYFDEKKEFGGSPDGLIGEDGVFENKNAAPRVQYKRLEKGWRGTEHIAQCQGNMLVTDRKWCDLQSYCRGLPNIIVRIKRDEGFILKLRTEIKLFNQEVQNLIDKYSI